MLLASAATLPLLLGIAGCHSSDAFAGPDPLGRRPQPGPDVLTLQAVITAEEHLIGLYRAAVTVDPAATVRTWMLRSLLAQHEQHLAQLRARLVIPPGASSPAARPAASPSASPSASSSGPGPVSIGRLRAAETASAAALVRRLTTVQPSLAQLFASIAASDATHAAALVGPANG